MSLSATVTEAKSTTPSWETFKDDTQILLVEKHDRPLVSWMIALPFGNYTDPKGKEGLTQFMGQMLLRGSQRHTRAQIEEALDNLGTSIDVSCGSTSFLVEGEILSKNLTKLLDLAVELLTDPLFDPAEIEKQKQENLSQLELKLESDADLARRAFYRSIYGNHPYARDSLGTAESIRSFTREDLVAHHRQFVHRGGLLIGMAGDIRHESFKEKVSFIHKSLQPGSLQPLEFHPEQKIEGRQVVLVDKPDRTQTHFFIGRPALSLHHEDFLPLKLFMMAFAGPMFQAQYMKEIRVVRGWSYGAYGTTDGRRDGGSVSLYTFPKTKDTVPAIQLSLELLENAAHGQGLPDTALDFARNYMARSFPFAIDLPEKVLSEMVYNKLVGKSDNFLSTYVKTIRGITNERAREAARKHLNSKDVVISILCTKKDFEKSIAKDLSAKSVRVIPYNQMNASN